MRTSNLRDLAEATHQRFSPLLLNGYSYGEEAGGRFFKRSGSQKIKQKSTLELAGGCCRPVIMKKLGLGVESVQDTVRESGI